MSISVLKIRLLRSYSNWFNQCKIDNRSTIIPQKEYLIHAHNLIRIVDYYEYWGDKGYSDNMYINSGEYMKAMYEIEKGIQLSKITYYE